MESVRDGLNLSATLRAAVCPWAASVGQGARSGLGAAFTGSALNAVPAAAGPASTKTVALNSTAPAHYPSPF